MKRLVLVVAAILVAALLLAAAFWSNGRGASLFDLSAGSGVERIIEGPEGRGTEMPTPVSAGPGAGTTETTASPSQVATAEPAGPDEVSTPTPAAEEPRSRQRIEGIWLNEEEVEALPPLPAEILEWAERSIRIRIGDQDNQADAVVVAAAYACLKTGEEHHCERAREILQEVSSVDVLGRKTLALNRNLAGYVVAADLIDYRDPAFSKWLQELIHKETWNAWTDEWSVYHTAMAEPTNGGCHARAAVTAVALYTEDEALLNEVANRFHDWLGRSGEGWLWDMDESWWQSEQDPALYNGVNPAGATLLIDGDVRNVDGVLPEDMKRSGRPEYPFAEEGYVRECQQGMVATAWMLQRAGYPAFEWQDQAVLRSFRWFVEEAEGEYSGDDAGLPYLIRYVYGVDYTSDIARPGKNGLGFYDWTHGEGRLLINDDALQHTNTEGSINHE
jgi:hypothetical protein